MAEDVKKNDKATEEGSSVIGATIDINANSRINKITMLLLAVVVMFCSGGGYGLAKIFANPDTEKVEKTEDTLDIDFAEENAVEELGTWEYELDSVIANLDEPGVTRYIRTTLILRFSSELIEADYQATLDSKKADMIDWLYTYMAGLSLEEVQGTRSIERFKKNVLKNFNELLFPETKPMLKQVLTKEFQVQ